VNQKQLIILVVLVALSVLILNAWSYWSMDESRSQARRAQVDAALCQKLSQEILELQRKPAIAGTREQATEELAARVELAARQSGISGDNLASIAPDAAVRVGDSDYLEKATSVQLRAVTLNQLAGLFGEISTEGSLRVKSLRLTAPPQDSSVGHGPTELWSAEFSIAYLIYSPLPKTSSSAANNE
jgi:hypothetical protein